jgi:threonylcarbamoyladenosine tRNA methylthiotransferase MtaB
VSGPRVAIATLGCKVNAYDTAAIAERLRAAGCRVVASGEAADVVIVNSCTVTDAAAAASRRLARRTKRERPACRVVVTGCWAQTDPAAAARLAEVDHVVGLNRLDALVAATLGPAAARVVVGNSRRERAMTTVGARRFPAQDRAYLKVQEGCDLFCTFCIVPLARGASRSLPPAVVVEEVRALAAAGFEEVVLTGVHLGGYGHDLDPPVDLAHLLARLLEDGAVPRLRLSSVDPPEVTERLVDLIAHQPALCQHLHVPLQAADDGVLGRMRRRYDTTLARERLALIRDRLPDAAIGTDLIAGFPGEDDAAFERTLAFLAESPVTYAHVFPYSVRRGTTAAKLDGRNPPPVIAARARRLRAEAGRLQRRFARRFAGAPAELLVETRRDPRDGALRGYTRNYLRARLHGPDAWRGRRLPVVLDVATDGTVGARVASGAGVPA